MFAAAARYAPSPLAARVLAAVLLAGAALFCAHGCARPESGRVHLVWATHRDDLGFDHAAVKRFEQANPDISVSLIEMSHDTDNMHNQYATWLVAEDASVDIYSIDVIWPAEFGSAGWALPLEDELSADERAKFLPGALEACTYQGHIYAIPWYGDAGMLYYRKDLLDAAGVKPPTTWTGLVDAARRLRSDSRRGFVFQAAQYEGLVCNFLEYAWGNGGTVLDPAGRVVLDSPQNTRALQFLVDMIRREGITPPSIVTFKEDESLNEFQNGSAVFLRSWPYVWGLTQQSGQPLLGRVGVAPMPHADGAGHRSAACLGGWNLMISRYSEHPQAAWRFASFITSFDEQRRRFIEASQLATRIAPYHDATVLAAHPQADDLLAVLELARPRPVTPYYSKLSDILQIELHRAITGELAPQDALAGAAAQIRRIPGFEGAP